MIPSEGGSLGSSPFAKEPRGRGVVWMRRIANIGFAIAALYFVYLVSILVVASNVNSKLEGEKLGAVQVEDVAQPVTGVTESALVKTDLWSASKNHRQVVVLWATWCGPCHSLLMDLKDEVAAGRLNADFITAVSMVEPLSDVAAYLQKTSLPFRVALDRKGDLARRVKLQGTPTVVFLDDQGDIHKITTGGFGLSGKISDFLKP